jgi:hypothetical protein
MGQQLDGGGIQAAPAASPDGRPFIFVPLSLSATSHCTLIQIPDPDGTKSQWCPLVHQGSDCLELTLPVRAAAVADFDTGKPV